MAPAMRTNEAMTAIYRKRNNLFEKGEREWRVEYDALAQEAPDGTTQRKPWRDVAEARLRYMPVNSARWRYLFEIGFRDGTCWQVDNVHFAGISDFEDRSASYVPFVRAALERIRAEAPGARLYSGARAASYYAQAGFAIAVLLVLAAILTLVPLGGVPLLPLRLLLVAWMIPPFIKWLRRSRPRALDLNAALPPGVLPS
jgi:hypothetical protein